MSVMSEIGRKFDLLCPLESIRVTLEYRDPELAKAMYEHITGPAKCSSTKDPELDGNKVSATLPTWGGVHSFETASMIVSLRALDALPK